MSGKRPSLADTMRQMVSEPSPAVPPSAPAKQIATAASEAPTLERPAGFYASTRVGKKKITASVDPAIHTQLKILAAQRGTTTEALLSEAIADLFRKLGAPEAK